MANRLRVVALWGGAVLAAWLAVGSIWYWRAYEPSSGDLLLGLLGMPVLLVAGYFVLKHAWTHLQVSVPAAEEQARLSDEGQASAALEQPKLLVLGGSVKLAAGESQELAQACAEGKRPGLDAQLRDAQGFPVLAARVVELDEVDVLAWWDGAGLDALLPQGRGWVAQLPEARTRELRLLMDVLASSATEVERSLVQLFEEQAPSRGAASPNLRKSFDEWLPVAQVRLWLRPGWTLDDWKHLQPLAQLWLTRSAPVLRFDVQMNAQPAQGQSPQLDFPWPTVLLKGRGAEFSAPIGAESEEVWLLAAAHSEVGQSEVDGLAAEGRLYGPQRREGRMVGEGAAALAVLRQDSQGGHLVDGLPVIASAKAIPAAGATGALAADLVAPMLDACGVSMMAVGKVLSDADHRPSCAMEAALLQSQQCPDLPAEMFAMVGVPCGHTAGVAAVASLVLAADFARAEQCAALAVSLASASWRAAALLMPPGWSSTPVAIAAAPASQGSAA